MKKSIVTVIATTLVASIGFAQQTPAPAEKAAADPIVIAAGDLVIRQSEFEKALKSLPAEYQQIAMGTGKKQFADDYLRMKLLASQGTKAGLDKDPDVLNQLALLRENLIANAQLERIEKGITITDEDLKKQYEENMDEYEQVKARHILVAFQGSPAAQADKPGLTEEQAKAKAEEIRNQLVAGASFDEVAKKESDDVGSGQRGGDLGEFGRGQMVPEFEKAAFEAKAGEITPVVRTQFGYHVIRVDEHTSTPFEEVKEFLQRNERQQKLRDALEKLKADANVTYNDAYFAPPAPKAAPAEEAKPAADVKKQ